MMKRKGIFIVVFFVIVSILSICNCVYGASYRNGWADEGGKRYYYNYSRKYRSGTYKIENKEYYFDKDGVMLSNNWAQDLEDDSKPWYWANPDGTLVTGWKSINGKWYYFDNYYRMVTGVKELKGNTYLFNDSGAMVEGTGWYSQNNKWYYLLGGGSNTTIVINCWKQIGNTWYYFGKDGVMYDKPSSVNYKYECFTSSGAWIETPKDGWFSCTNSNGKTDWWYYKKGFPEYGWQKINGTWYYFGFSDGGKMYDKPTKIAGKIECFDASGAWIESPKNGWFSYKNSEGKTEWYYFENGQAVTGWKKLGNDWYYMDKYTGLMYSDKELYDTNDNRNYYFKSSGEMAIDFWRINEYGSWKHYNKDGVREEPYGWENINGNYYYFGTGNILIKNTISKIDGKYYMFDKDGKRLSNGWYSQLDVQIDYEMGKSDDGYYKEIDQWYYIGEDGVIQISKWIKDETGGDCYLDQYGKKVQNKKEEIDDKIYCFDENGHKIVNGFFETENNRKYYLGDDGVAYVEKWLKNYNGYDYYFDMWGYMVRDRQQCPIKNKETNKYEYYDFDSEGRCIGKK